ncbi:MAG: ABC transporter substrate-binding protein [Thermomicrobiales bacterium]
MSSRTVDERMRALEARGIDRRQILRLLGAGAGAAALTGMPVMSGRGGTAVFAQDAAPGGTLTYARDGDADSLDPHKTTTTLSWQVQGQIYETLTAFDADGNIVPNLAKSWEISDDGLTYTFHLQEGVTFHDGTPLNAEAVKFTFDRFMAEETANPSKASIGPLTGTEAVDDLTVTMTFESPFAPLLSFLTDPFAGIVSPAGVKAAGDDFGNKPVGSGPFMFKEWVKGDRIVLDRFPDYKGFHPMYQHEGPAYLDQVIYRTMPEEQARLAALETGEVNMAEPPLEEVARLQGDASYTVYVAPNTGQLVFFEFAVHRAPFDDARVRQAVGYGVDTAALVSIGLNDLVQATQCTVGPGILGGDSEVCKTSGFSHDPEKAKSLLAEAGYGDAPLEVTLATWTGGNREDVAQLIQNQLNQAGFNVKLETMDIGSLNARVKAENNTNEGGGFFDMMGWAWFDPDILYALFHSPGWVDGFSSPELDAMLEEQRQTTDRDARLAKIDEIQKYILENAAMVPLYSPGWNWILASPASVKGFQFAPFNRALLYDVSIEG